MFRYAKEKATFVTAFTFRHRVWHGHSNVASHTPSDKISELDDFEDWQAQKHAAWDGLQAQDFDIQ